MAGKSQLLKGLLEGCVLKIIDTEGEVYGYDILRILKEKGLEDISEGTLYPLYIRLQKNGYIAFTMRESPQGPSRKYYSLTETGREQLKEFENEWEYLSGVINGIIRL